MPILKWWRRLRYSLRYSLSARLLVLFIITAIVLGMILSSAFGLAFQRQFRDVIRPHIAQYLDYILQDIGDPPVLERAQALATKLPLDVYIKSSDMNWASTVRPLDLSRFEDWRRHRGRHWPRGQVTIADDDEGRFLIHARLEHASVYLLLQSRPRRHHGGFWVGLGAIIAVGLVLWLCYAMIRRLFRPLETIQTGVQRFAEGDLNHRVTVKRRDELGALAGSINAMAAEINKMLEAKRQLLLAISHELRSPLTRAKVNTALLEDSSTRQALETDMQEMESLLADLLESERLSGRHSTLNRQAVAVSELISELLAEQFPNAPIEVQLDLHNNDQELYLLLDPLRIKLLLKNLLENALRHSPADQNALLRCRFDGLTLQLQVQDFGQGIAPEHLPHLTEPFYRVDPARQRKTGGYGLGLYLCRMIAEAHGGKLQIDSQPGHGTTVTVTVPMG